MAPLPTMCAACFRAAQRAVARGPRNLSNPARSYSRAVPTAHPPQRLQAPTPSTLQRTAKTSSSLSRRYPATLRTLATAAEPQAPSPSSAQLARPIQNPRNDESGKPMQISLSPRAAHRLSTISTTDKNPNLALRVMVESGGCHGFQYLMSLADLGKEPATEEDTVFEGEKGVKVVIDESSLELLNGSTVDYTMELIGSQFKVTGIPGATSSCGCGTSFDVKM